MKIPASLFPVLGLLLAHGSLAKVPLSSVKKETNLPTVPNQFIVEVDSASDIPTKRSLSPHQALYASLKARAVGFKVDKEFDSDIFVGAVLTLTDSQSVAKISSAEGVKAIRPVVKYARPAPVRFDKLAPGDTPDLQTTHILTGVDKLHAEGIFGKGVKIGILDTGIDYTHPALGGGFGPGFKVIGGFDLVGDDYTGANEPVPDDDPLDQCAGHGTHVAGIIGANPDNQFNISGVAYEASLSAYRVFGCEGFVTDPVLIDALIRGNNDGQDILTLSLGGPDGWTEGSTSVVASRLSRLGKVVTIAAGNEGSSGSWFSSGPGNGIDVISVASLDNTAIALQNATVNGVQHDPITYFELFPIPITEALPIFATSNDTTVVDDACNPLPDDTPDLSPFLVVVRRGTCTFVQKLTNIAAKGGKISFIYDNGNGFAGIDVGNFNATLIQAADGEFLVSQFAAGASITISFPQTGGSFDFPDPNGGLISSFTTYGPTNDFFFKPAVAAPGGNILSTLPTNMGSFGVASGTSMATPFVAGSAALLFSVKGKTADVGRGARTLFETTAKPVSSSHTDGDPFQTATQQGAGLINVFDAIHATTIVSPGEFILNDTAHFRRVQTFTVKNTGTTAKSFNVSNVPAGTAVSVTPDTIFPALGPVPLSTDFATIRFSRTSFRLNPGQTVSITATFTPPVGGDVATFPVYSGFIQIASGSELTHVTYVGLKASLIDKQVVDDTDFFFGLELPLILDGTGNVQTEPTNYTFVDTDWPTVLFRLAFGTASLRVDLVDANTTVETTLNKRAEPFITFTNERKKGSSFEAVPTVGAIAELVYIPRSDEDLNPFYTIGLSEPTFANGTIIPNGQYKFLLRALKVTGNPSDEAAYESWLSPIIGVAVP